MTEQPPDEASAPSPDPPPEREVRVDVEAFPRAGAMLAAIYLLGVAVIWLGPETKGKQLPD